MILLFPLLVLFAFPVLVLALLVLLGLVVDGITSR